MAHIKNCAKIGVKLASDFEDQRDHFCALADKMLMSC